MICIHTQLIAYNVGYFNINQVDAALASGL